MGDSDFLFILERVKDRRMRLPLLISWPCSLPITSRLSPRLQNSIRHIHLSFAFCFHSMSSTGQSSPSQTSLISASCLGCIMVMQSISEGGLKLAVLAIPSLLYSCSSSFCASFLSTRLSQWEQNTLKLGLAQLISSLAWIALSRFSYSTRALFFSLMKITLLTLPKFEKMLYMQSWSQFSGSDRANSTFDGQFSSRNCQELGLTIVFDFLLFISVVSSQVRNSSLSRAISRNCSSMSMKLLSELFSLDFLADMDSDLYLAEVELRSWSFSTKLQQLWAAGSCAQMGAIQSWKVLLLFLLECSKGSSCPCCCSLSDSQLTPPRLSL